LNEKEMEMKNLLLLLLLLGFSFPPLATADLQDECGQDLKEYLEIQVQIRDVQQFRKENQGEMDRFPRGRLSPQQLKEHQRLREENGRLFREEKELQERARDVRREFINCVERYKKEHRQSAQSGRRGQSGSDAAQDELRRLNNWARDIARQMGLNPNVLPQW
jgi:hypothetical protein